MSCLWALSAYSLSSHVHASRANRIEHKDVALDSDEDELPLSEQTLPNILKTHNATVTIFMFVLIVILVFLLTQLWRSCTSKKEEQKRKAELELAKLKSLTREMYL